MTPMSSQLNKVPRILVENNPALKDAENYFKSSEIVLEKGQKGTITGSDVESYLQSAGISQILSSREMTEIASKDKLDENEINNLSKMIESKSSGIKAREKKVTVKVEQISEKDIQKREKEYESLLKLELEKQDDSSNQEKAVKLQSEKNKKILIKKIENIFGKDSQSLVLKNGIKIDGVIEYEEVGDIKVYTTEGVKTFSRSDVDEIK